MLFRSWMNLANTSGTPNAGYQATSSGDAITSTRTDTGRYTVTMPGVEKAEHVIVSSWGTDTPCRPAGWTNGATALDVSVVCRDQDGDPSDAAFTIFAGRNVSIGAPSNGWTTYAVVRRPTVARYTVEKGQPHRLDTLAGASAARLFDGFEEARKGCSR